RSAPVPGARARGGHPDGDADGPAGRADGGDAVTYLPTLDTSELAELEADVRELTETWRRTIPVEDHYWDRNRNRKVRIRYIQQTYPPLLDSLRAMVYPGGTVRGPERRMVPRS